MSAAMQSHPVMSPEQDYNPRPMNRVVDGRSNNLSYTPEDRARYLYAKYRTMAIPF
jgi:hypothetical protein